MDELEFEIYFDDLTPEAQQRLLVAFGIKSPDEMNWNNRIFPVATVVKGEEFDESLLD
jgi:hypothetical protein